MSHPEWFEQVIQQRPESRYLDVDEIKIHYLVWGDKLKPVLFFIHGYSAHAHWWDFIAPHFLETFCVIAIDLSGMGDSEHRKAYSQDLYAKEIKVVCDHEEIDSAYFLAHSMGGSIAVNTASLYPDLFKALLLIDSVVVVPPDKVKAFSSRRSMLRHDFIYDQFEEAIDSFRLIPPQPCRNDFLLKYIAQYSYREIKGKWTLKSDGLIMKSYDSKDLTELFMNLQCPLYIVYGLMSQIFSQELLDYTVYVGKISEEKIIGIPGAMHHLFIDEPLVFVENVKQLLIKREKP